MPNPLDAKIGGQYIDINSVDKDKSYLISFLEHGDAGSGDVHVNFRGYPGHTAIPRCTTVIPNGTKTIRGKTRVLRGRVGRRTAPGIKATVYRVNQDADQWHILLAWKHKGSLYTVSEHVIKPLRQLDDGAEESRAVARTASSSFSPRADAPHASDRFSGARRPPQSAAPASTSSSTGSTPRRSARAGGPLPREQHVFDLRSVESEGVEVVVPPLHSEIVTATIKATIFARRSTISNRRCRSLDEQYAPTPRGSA